MAPDVAVDIARDVSRESPKLLATVQTSHDVDKTIASLIAKDTPSIASLAKWSRHGSPILRVNATGILAKVGSPSIDNDAVQALKVDQEARALYLTAVIARVLGVPWEDAGQIAIDAQPLTNEGQIQPFATEACNVNDSGARWCSVVILSRTRRADPHTIDGALSEALRKETSRENLRAIACTLAGLDPLTV
jgi:hypothetical protein